MNIQRVSVIPVLAPLPRALRTASGFIERAPLVLIDVTTDAGVTGRAYGLVYMPELLPALAAAVLALGAMATGMALAPRDVNAALRTRLRLLGVKNLVGMALSGLDMAVWDAWARAQDKPLAVALGATPRPHRTYNSLGLYDATAVGQVVDETLAGGFAGMKIKAGFAAFRDDLAAVRAARKRLGDEVALMVDFNQSLTVDEARARCRALDGEGLAWIEEPVLADDFSGCAGIAAATDTPIQIGENFQGTGEMKAALDARACDLVMPDAQMIGGVTGWLEAAALARHAGISMSSHLFPEASAHLLCATPTAHWLEYMDMAAGILAQPCRIEQGMVAAPDRPGLGLEWDNAAVERCRIR